MSHRCCFFRLPFPSADFALLKKRLIAYAEHWPDCCNLVGDDSNLGRMTFEVAKGRFCFQLSVPYSVERREAAQRYAKENHCADKLKNP